MTFHRTTNPRSLALLLALSAAWLGHSVPVGTYLYSTPSDLPKRYPGTLVVEFRSTNASLVIAYGHRYRKDRYSRRGTDEAERAEFKPFKARLEENGRRAVFAGLPPDYYDVVVFDAREMRLWEGIDLLRRDNPEPRRHQLLSEIEESLTATGPGAVAWEAFFDTKRFERVESKGDTAAVFLQQLRRKPSVAESGKPIEGCIHSVDICWVAKAAGGAGWQVLTRQQLYRQELSSRNYFSHRHVPSLQAVRVGTRTQTLGPLSLNEEQQPEKPKE